MAALSDFLQRCFLKAVQEQAQDIKKKKNLTQSFKYQGTNKLSKDLFPGHIHGLKTSYTNSPAEAESV